MSSLASIFRLARAHVALLLAELTSIAAEARRIIALLALSLLIVVGGSLVIVAGFAVAAGQSAFGSGIWGATVAGPLLAASGVLIAGIALRAPRSLLLMVPVAGVGAGVIVYLPLQALFDGRWVLGATWSVGAIAAMSCAIAVVRAADRAALRERLLPTESLAAARTTADQARDAVPEVMVAAADVVAAREEVRGERAKQQRSLGETFLTHFIDGALERLRRR
jgi:hypothetical protein